MKEYKERKTVFRVYSTGNNGVTVENILGKFERRSYRIREVDKKGKEGGVYKFELADPKIPAEIEEIILAFEKLKVNGGYLVEAICNIVKIDEEGKRREFPQKVLNKKETEIRFGKGVQKGLIRILEEEKSN